MQGIIDIRVSNTIPRVNKIFQSSLSRVFFPTEHDSKVLNCILVNQSQLDALNGVNVPSGFNWQLPIQATLTCD